MARRSWFGWWYLSIAVGFVLLAANRLLVGGWHWTVGLRFVIAAGFIALAVFEFRVKRS